MPVVFAVRGATQLADGIWEGAFQPGFLRLLGPAKVRSGSISILLLSAQGRPKLGDDLITVDPEEATVLCAGDTERVLFVFGQPSSIRAVPSQQDTVLDGTTEGVQLDASDKRFLQESEALPPPLAAAARELLAAMRSAFGGHFERTQSGRFVNRPDNFWTVKVQPRDGSLRFTVRGATTRFRGGTKLNVRPDRNGYSTFKASTRNEIAGALDLLRRAAMN